MLLNAGMTRTVWWRNGWVFFHLPRESFIFIYLNILASQSVSANVTMTKFTSQHLPCSFNCEYTFTSLLLPLYFLITVFIPLYSLFTPLVFPLLSIFYTVSIHFFILTLGGLNWTAESLFIPLFPDTYSVIYNTMKIQMQFFHSGCK